VAVRVGSPMTLFKKGLQCAVR